MIYLLIRSSGDLPDLPLAVFPHPKNQATEPFRRGRPLRRTYQAQLLDDLIAIDLQLNAAVDAAPNRTEWQRLVKALK